MQKLFRHLPQQRQLSKEAKDKAAALLKMKAKKKMIQQQLTQETGNVVLLKDLTNIALLEKRGKTRNDLDKSVTLLMEKYGN